MEIKTKDFELTRKEYFKILMINYFRWWFIAFIFVIGIFLRKNWYWQIGLLYCIWLIIYFWFYANSKKNKIFFKRRRFEINDDFLIGYLEDGSLDKLKIDNIVKVIRKARYYLLYMSKSSFIYFPLEIFSSSEDINNFDALLKSKKLLKG